MVAADETELMEVAVVAVGSEPVATCGGCRQKMAEFASSELQVTMANFDDVIVTSTLRDLLPGAFTARNV